MDYYPNESNIRDRRDFLAVSIQIDSNNEQNQTLWLLLKIKKWELFLPFHKVLFLNNLFELIVCASNHNDKYLP